MSGHEGEQPADSASDLERALVASVLREAREFEEESSVANSALPVSFLAIVIVARGETPAVFPCPSIPVFAVEVSVEHELVILRWLFRRRQHPCAAGRNSSNNFASRLRSYRSSPGPRPGGRRVPERQDV